MLLRPMAKNVLTTEKQCTAVSYKGWQNWVVAIIGAWMIVSGFWFPASYVATVANDIVAGAVIILLSLWAWAGSSGVPQPKEA